MIKSAKIVKYADDTVIYVADKDVAVINSKLTKDMDDCQVAGRKCADNKS